MGKLAEAYVEIATKQAQLDSGLSTAKSKVSGFVDSIKATAGNTLVALGPLAAGLVGVEGFKKAVMGAADLNETISKTEIVFGKASQSVVDFSDEMNRKFGSNKRVVLDAAASIGLIAKASGLAQPEAAALSTKLAGLADDASSFYNVPLPEALDKIKSALVGESEPIRSFGVLLNEAAVQNEAMVLGLSKTGKELTEGQKVMARSSLIIKGLKDATGDHERTQGSFSNQLKEVQGRLENLASTMGQSLLPGLTAVLAKLNPVISKFEEMASAIRRAAEASALFDQGDILGALKAAGGSKDLFSMLGNIGPEPEFVGGTKGGASFGVSPKEKMQAAANSILGRLGDAINAGAQLKNTALSGVGVAGNALFGGEKKSMNVGITDSEGYARELAEGALKGGDVQAKILDEQKKAVSELGAIKEQLMRDAKKAVRAAFG